MENPIIETRQKLIDHIKNYNKDEPTIADYQALYLAITGYSNIINNIKGTEDLLNFYKDCDLKHEFFQKKLVTEIIKQNSSIINSSGTLSILINNLKIEDEELKKDLVIGIVNKRSWIIKDLINSTKLSTFINELKITDD